MKINNIIKKIIGFSIILIILFLLGRILFENWHKLKGFEYSFSYINLFISIILLLCSFIFMGLVWNIILRILEKQNTITFFEAIIITIFIRAGRYVPGKIWGVVGAIYLGNKKNIPKTKIFISYTLQTVISTLSAILLGAILAIIFLGKQFNYLYFLLVGVLPIFILLLRQDLFLKLVNFLLKKFKRQEIADASFLSISQVFKILLYESINQLMHGLAFIFLIKSITHVPINNVFPIIGIYLLANVSGFVALFAPGGIGVKEGVLTVLLKYYFPLGVAVLISILARVWIVLADLISFILALPFYKKIKYYQ